MLEIVAESETKPNVSVQAVDLARQDVHDFGQNESSWVYATHASTILGPTESPEQHAALMKAGATVPGSDDLPLFYQTASVATPNGIMYGDMPGASPGLVAGIHDAVASGLYDPVLLDSVIIKENRREAATGIDAAGQVGQELLYGGTEQARDNVVLNSHYSPVVNVLNFDAANGADLRVPETHVILHELSHGDWHANANSVRNTVNAGLAVLGSEPEREVLRTLGEAGPTSNYITAVEHGAEVAKANASEMYADVHAIAAVLVVSGKDAALDLAATLVDGRDALHQRGLERVPGGGDLVAAHVTEPAVLHFADLIEQGKISQATPTEELKAAVYESVAVGYTENLITARMLAINPVTLTEDGLRSGLPEGVSAASLVAQDLAGNVAMSEKPLRTAIEGMTVFIPEGTGGIPSSVLLADAGIVTADTGKSYVALVMPRESEAFSTADSKSQVAHLDFPGNVPVQNTPLGDYLAQNGAATALFRELNSDQVNAAYDRTNAGHENAKAVVTEADRAALVGAAVGDGNKLVSDIAGRTVMDDHAITAGTQHELTRSETNAKQNESGEHSADGNQNKHGHNGGLKIDHNAGGHIEAGHIVAASIQQDAVDGMAAAAGAASASAAVASAQSVDYGTAYSLGGAASEMAGEMARTSGEASLGGAYASMSGMATSDSAASNAQQINNSDAVSLGGASASSAGYSSSVTDQASNSASLGGASFSSEGGASWDAGNAHSAQQDVGHAQSSHRESERSQSTDMSTAKHDTSAAEHTSTARESRSRESRGREMEMSM